MTNLRAAFGSSFVLLAHLAFSLSAAASDSSGCELHGGGRGELLALQVRDTGGDGYNKTRTYSICSNLGTNALAAALSKGESKLGVSLSDETSEYGDHSVSAATIRKLIAAGMRMPEGVALHGEQEVALGFEEYVKINLMIVRHGNSNFQYRSISIPKVDLRGYGILAD